MSNVTAETDEETGGGDIWGQPPSVKLVYLVLESRSSEALNQDRIVAETRLPKRTVRYALRRLRELNLVESRSRRDRRVTEYRLTEEPGDN